MTEVKLPLVDEAATIDLARRIAAKVETGLVFYLHGDLGAGKTTFARALLIALGVGERVKSPTYSLVESYEVDGRSAWHLDLYRIADAGELEWLGLDALAEPDAIVAGHHGRPRACRRRPYRRVEGSHGGRAAPARRLRRSQVIVFAKIRNPALAAFPGQAFHRKPSLG